MCVKVYVIPGLVLFILLTSSFVIGIEASSTTWIQTYDAGGVDSLYVLVETSDGGYALAGETESSESNSDFWLVKTDALGNMQWDQKYGGAEPNIPTAMVQTSDGGYALAGYISFETGTADSWLVKTDADGNMQWNKTYGGADYDDTYSLVETSDGGYALAGVTSSFSSNYRDFWLIKTDVNGNMEWNKTYGGSYDCVANSLIKTSEGGYAITGMITNYDNGTSGFWLVKTDSKGNMQWNQTYRGENHTSATSLVETSDGGYALAGETNNDFWLIKTDANGNMEWNQTYGGTDKETLNKLIITSDKGYALTGSTQSFGAGYDDGWLVKADAFGNMQWNQTYGGKYYDNIHALIEASDGEYILAGTQSVTSNYSDGWLLKTDNNGTIPELQSWIISAESKFQTQIAIVGIVAAVIIPLVIFYFKRKRKARIQFKRI